MWCLFGFVLVGVKELRLRMGVVFTLRNQIIRDDHIEIENKTIFFKT